MLYFCVSNENEYHMNQVTVLAGTHLSGTIWLPASKSVSNRALILNALCQGSFPVSNLSDCDDTRVVQNALRGDKEVIDVGAAGTAMRFLTSYLSNIEGVWIITGTERMKNRPIKILVDALIGLGARIEYLEKKGYPPLKITGTKLNGGVIELDGSVSSQYISALLMVAPLMAHGLTILLTGNAVSEPYLQMTIRMMQAYGVEVVRDGNQLQVIKQSYRPIQYVVESDWSAASYWYEMMALSSDEKAEIVLLGLQQNSMQGDSSVAQIFEPLGVETVYTSEGILLRKKEAILDFFEYNFVNEPDLAQTVVVTCMLQNIPFRFSGLQSLKIKETDRVLALQKEMRKLGYVLSAKDDSILFWNGGREEQKNGVSIDTYDDHRMAMAFAPVALKLGEITINHPQVISKSYPGYWTDLKKIGFQLV